MNEPTSTLTRAALVALVIWPIVWLISILLKLVGTGVGAALVLVKTILFFQQRCSAIVRNASLRQPTEHRAIELNVVYQAGSSDSRMSLCVYGGLTGWFVERPLSEEIKMRL